MSALSLLAPAEVACCQDETWEPIPDWPHEASTCGRVRSVDRLGDDGIWRLGAPVPLQPDKRPGKGYLYATLLDGKRRRKAHVAVLVLEAHRRLRPGPDWEASHIYGIRTDNHLDGLEWETRAQNLARIKLHAAERAVTAQGAETADTSQGSRFPSMARDAARRDSRYGVTPISAPGLSPSIPISPSHSTPVQPILHTLRTSFRSLRNRQAA